MASKIDTVTARGKLKPRREPYWHKLNRGCYLGFRKMSDDSSGTWVARYRDEGTGRQSITALGTFDTYQAHERFDNASAAAREWFKHMGLGGNAEILTVRDACVRYIEHVRQEKGDKPADDMQARLQRLVYSAPISKIELSKLGREHVRAFRKRVMSLPVKVKKTGEQRARAKDTINRDISPLRAALNFAHREGWVTSDFAWREALKPIKDAGRRRELYLDRKQRRALIKNAPNDLGRFLRALALLPLRPGALAALKVANFDRRLTMLKIGKDKAGRDRKIKLPQATADFLTQCAKDKLPAAPLLSRASGEAWNKDAWKRPVKEAAKVAGLPPEATAYTLRHSVITDLVHGGLDLLTVAQISGTSVAMIEKHYGHLRQDVAASALSRLAL